MRNTVFQITISLAVFIGCTDALAQERPRSAVAQNCEDLDFTIKREESPYHYTNPNEACNISLKLDGLPSKSGGGYSSSGNDACGQIQSVVGDLEGRLNERLQGALGEIGDVVSPEDLAQIGGAAGVDVSGISSALRDGATLAEGSVTSETAETLTQTQTDEGRDGLRDDFRQGASEAARESLNNQQQGRTTPGINSSSDSSGSSEWSIFD